MVKCSCVTFVYDLTRKHVHWVNMLQRHVQLQYSMVCRIDNQDVGNQPTHTVHTSKQVNEYLSTVKCG